jgi:hypothetical protein
MSKLRLMQRKLVKKIDDVFALKRVYVGGRGGGEDDKGTSMRLTQDWIESICRDYDEVLPVDHEQMLAKGFRELLRYRPFRPSLEQLEKEITEMKAQLGYPPSPPPEGSSDLSEGALEKDLLPHCACECESLHGTPKVKHLRSVASTPLGAVKKPVYRQGENSRGTSRPVPSRDSGSSSEGVKKPVPWKKAPSSSTPKPKQLQSVLSTSSSGAVKKPVSRGREKSSGKSQPLPSRSCNPSLLQALARDTSLEMARLSCRTG